MNEDGICWKMRKSYLWNMSVSYNLNYACEMGAFFLTKCPDVKIVPFEVQIGICCMFCWNYIDALNSETVENFHLESETLWCSGYIPSLVSTSADRKFLLCYWATYVTERLCLFFHWAFVYFISVNEIAHFRITSVE